MADKLAISRSLCVVCTNPVFRLPTTRNNKTNHRGFTAYADKKKVTKCRDNSLRLSNPKKLGIHVTEDRTEFCRKELM